LLEHWRVALSSLLIAPVWGVDLDATNQHLGQLMLMQRMRHRIRWRSPDTVGKGFEVRTMAARWSFRHWWATASLQCANIAFILRLRENQFVLRTGYVALPISTIAQHLKDAASAVPLSWQARHKTGVHL
jgi:hypothetical protein